MAWVVGDTTKKLSTVAKVMPFKEIRICTFGNPGTSVLGVFFKSEMACSDRGDKKLYCLTTIENRPNSTLRNDMEILKLT